MVIRCKMVAYKDKNDDISIFIVQLALKTA
jgi:hypothetical protein